MSGSSDWRTWCSPIQDQGDCGSCTAFGTIGAWEPNIRIAENNQTDPVKLSERDLFFCSGGTCGAGNTPEATLNQCEQGICSESCCPYGTVYSGIDSSCGQGRCTDYVSTQKKLASWAYVTTAAQMKQLLQKGPLASTMTVHQSFFNYVSGVYHNLGANDAIAGGHMIAIVGYDDTQQAWLLRNSWGTGWGMSGYCWIAYGDSEIDVCMYQVVPAAPTPPPPPPPSNTATILVSASDPSDKVFGFYSHKRDWEIWVDKAPGNYQGKGNFATPADYSIATQSGNTISYTTGNLASGRHTLIFVVTQSGGQSLGQYSGVITINGVATSFQGVDVYHPTVVPFTI